MQIAAVENTEESLTITRLPWLAIESAKVSRRRWINYGDEWDDQRDFQSNQGWYQRQQWQPLLKGMRGYDKSNPFVVEIFGIRDLIKETLLAEQSDFGALP